MLPGRNAIIRLFDVARWPSRTTSGSQLGRPLPGKGGQQAVWKSVAGPHAPTIASSGRGELGIRVEHDVQCCLAEPGAFGAERAPCLVLVAQERADRAQFRPVGLGQGARGGDGVRDAAGR